MAERSGMAPSFLAGAERYMFPGHPFSVITFVVVVLPSDSAVIPPYQGLYLPFSEPNTTWARSTTALQVSGQTLRERTNCLHSLTRVSHMCENIRTGAYHMCNEATKCQLIHLSLLSLEQDYVRPALKICYAYSKDRPISTVCMLHRVFRERACLQLHRSSLHSLDH